MEQQHLPAVVPNQSAPVADHLPNTKRAYDIDWRTWRRWCEANNRCPMPAAPGDVADFIRARAYVDGAALSSIKRFLAALSTASRIAKHPFDRRHDSIHFLLRRLARERGTAPANARAEISTDELLAMLPKGDGPQAIRDRALLLVGFAGGFRRSELAAMDVLDIEWKRDGIVVRIPRSKTDQTGKGQHVGILYGRREKTCPVRALKAWLAARGPLAAFGAVFLTIVGSRIEARRIEDRVVYRAVKRYAKAAGMDATKLGAHSLRVGHVTTALANGADPVKAKEQLRHRKLDTTLGYNRAGAALLRENTSGKLGL
jgi:integrase